MKKIFLLILAASVVFGCVRPELDTPAVDEIVYNTVLTANIPETKVAIDDAYTKLCWSNGDKISVLTSSGAYREFVYTGTDGATSAEFKGNLKGSETIAGWAIYPAHSDHAVVTSTGQPRVYLPNEYEWKEGQVMGPMVASITDGKASFTHAGGLFAFDVKNMPAGTDAFRFYTSKLDISGITTYEYQGILKAGENDEDGSYVDMKFDALTAATDMKFYIPVPTGSYEDFTIYFHNSNHEEANEHGNVFIRKSNSTNVIEAATVKVFTVAIEGGVWYVTESGTAEADGLSWTTATTLSNALSKAKDGDVIYVGAGTYVPDTFISGKAIDAAGKVAAEETTATESAHKAFIVNKNVTILGGYPAAGGSICNPETNKTILSGNDECNHVVLVAAPKVAGKSVKMSGFTVTKAASATNSKEGWQINENAIENQNGAFYIAGTSLTLADMVFTANKSVNASAIYGLNSKVDIKNCSFTNNTASANGTIWFSDGSELTFSDSEISGNTAGNAPGLYLQLFAGAQMTANVSNVTITNNTATTRGAVYLRTATAGQTLNATLDGCIISSNTSLYGAGAYLLNANGVVFKNTLFEKNKGTGTGSAVNQGGAFASLDACATYEACEFIENTSASEGVMMVNSKTYATTNVFDKCIWKGNTNTNWGNLLIRTEGEFNTDVVIKNSLFNENSVKGRGGALYARSYAASTVDVKCINTTFYGNKATSRGTAVLSYSNDDNYVTNVDLISCTIYNNTNTSNYYAVMAETGKTDIGTASVNLYNSLIAGNAGSSNANYNVSLYLNGKITRYNCQNGTTYYGADGKNAGANTFNYATMLGDLNTEGVCPLLLPESNPAVTGGMSPAELAALASANVPASVLTVDQLGNERTGNVIGAWAATSAAADM